nr:aldehyde dehydrogenase (NADP(+)) [Phaeacidiphilus oryzae]
MNTVPVWSVDPRTGEQIEQVTVEATGADVDRAVRAAAGTRQSLADRARRAEFLRAVAAELESDGERIIAAADRESALGVPRLTGELARTAYQFRAFADVVDEGAYLDVIIDHADPQAKPVPRPDLRRWKTPLGVVAVFAASNFPLAFSVSGGDTASALAAGCPVVAKAHPDHPATSELTGAAIRRAAVASGLDEDVLVVVHGRQAGVDLVRHPEIAGVGFTGSVAGGRFLFDLAVSREQPIPFYGELGSLNPVVVTEAAASARAKEIGTGLAGSFTLGMGQFCTKPGLVLVPAGPAGDEVEAALAAAAGEAASGALLDPRMREAFLAGFAERAELAGVSVAVEAGADDGVDGVPLAVRPGYLRVAAADVGDGSALLEECFGPVTVIVRYEDAAEVERVLAAVGGNLTATLHAEADEPAARELLERLAGVAGRVLFGGWPTGVAVAAGMNHGGPYPSSTSTSTSVGATAIERWVRPVAFQNAPEALLPVELRDAGVAGLPRRVDGVLHI